MLVTAINVTKFDLTSIGGPEDGWIADSLFYEIDVKTNEVLFRWSSLAHLDEIPLEDVVQFYPLDDLGTNQTYPYGYFHINAVDKFQDGSYLISSRFYCSIFKISANGSVEWTLQVSPFTHPSVVSIARDVLTAAILGTQWGRLPAQPRSVLLLPARCPNPTGGRQRR
jgi:hypothetical protein